MAKAGDQYEHRTGNIWNYAQRDDVKTVARLIDEGLDPEMRNKVGWTPLHAASVTAPRASAAVPARTLFAFM